MTSNKHSVKIESMETWFHAISHGCNSIVSPLFTASGRKDEVVVSSSKKKASWEWYNRPTAGGGGWLFVTSRRADSQHFRKV